MLLPHHLTPLVVRVVAVVVVCKISSGRCWLFGFYCGSDNHEENGLDCLVSNFATLSHGSLWRIRRIKDLAQVDIGFSHLDWYAWHD